MNEKGLFYLEKKYAEALNALVSSKTKNVWRDFDYKLIDKCEKKFAFVKQNLEEFYANT